MANLRTVDLAGFKMVIDDEDPDVSRQLREEGWYSDERYEARIFAEQLRPGMTVLDLGANCAGFPLSHSHYGCWLNLKPDISLATKTGHFNLLPTELL